MDEMVRRAKPAPLALCKIPLSTIRQKPVHREYSGPLLHLGQRAVSIGHALCYSGLLSSELKTRITACANADHHWLKFNLWGNHAHRNKITV